MYVHEYVVFFFMCSNRKNYNSPFVVEQVHPLARFILAWMLSALMGKANAEKVRVTPSLTEPLGSSKCVMLTHIT